MRGNFRPAEGQVIPRDRRNSCLLFRVPSSSSPGTLSDLARRTMTVSRRRRVRSCCTSLSKSGLKSLNAVRSSSSTRHSSEWRYLGVAIQGGVVEVNRQDSPATTEYVCTRSSSGGGSEDPPRREGMGRVATTQPSLVMILLWICTLYT